MAKQKEEEEKVVSDFHLERYKYILQQIHSLNENIHKYLTLFQTLATAIVGGGATIFVSWKSLGIEAEVARASIQGLLGLLIILAIFVIISIAAGIFSWFNYRNEEVELLNEAVKPGFRSRPQLRNLWRWYEPYAIIFIIIAVMFIYTYVQNSILPKIQ